MFDNDFWNDAEVISVYTDADAIEDGTLIDISDCQTFINGKLINRVTSNCASRINLFDGRYEAKAMLSFIVEMAKKDRDGADAWGIVEQFLNQKLWLVGNEIGGYTLMLPSDY